MNPLDIIKKYYKEESEEYKTLVDHSRMVADRALEIVKKRNLKVDLKFLEEAAMLHDIGVFLVMDKSKPYVCHGYLGREILEKEGLARHGLVAERHVGTGITKKDIMAKQFWNQWTKLKQKNKMAKKENDHQ